METFTHGSVGGWWWNSTGRPGSRARPPMGKRTFLMRDRSSLLGVTCNHRVVFNDLMIRNAASFEIHWGSRTIGGWFDYVIWRKTIMKAAVVRLMPLALMAASSFAFASGHLTRQE